LRKILYQKKLKKVESQVLLKKTSPLK